MVQAGVSNRQQMASFVLLLVAPTSLLLLGCYGCEEGDIRLADGSNNSSGRVELCHGGEWGTVCDKNWNSDEARVVCRQLGLPTGFTIPIHKFGGGNGTISEVQCTGVEDRLELCNFKVNHRCDHSGDVGVICDVDIEQYGGEPCGFEKSELELAKEELERFGNCVPFKISEQGTPCDDFYTPGVDYVYISHQRTNGNIDRYLNFVERSDAFFFIIRPETCFEPAKRILCHFFLPPCGNSTSFEPPTSVCKEVCNYLQEMCPTVWKEAIELFEAGDFVRFNGITFINCSNTGEYLDPLPYCCSDVGVDIPCTEWNSFGNLVPDPSCNSTEPSQQNAGQIAITVGSVCAAVAVLLLVVIGVVTVIRIQRQRVKQNISEPWSPARTRYTQEAHAQHQDGTTSLELLPVVPTRAVSSKYIRQMNEESLLIPKKNIALQNCVGQGEFGIVCRAILSGWRGEEEEIVAVKTLKEVFTMSELNNVAEESLKMSKFNHPNVMRLVGVCIDGGESPYIVMPFMTHGSLLSYLRKHRAELTIANDDNTELVNASQKKLLSMCLQIAKGMSYLANEKFVHRDLAARNCMIDDNFVIKISDFGLTEDIYARNYFRQSKLGEERGDQVKLPVRWMALESLNDGVFTEKTDVWSFGVTCWEVFSLGKSPYPEMDPFALIKYLERGERLQKPVNAACSQEIYGTMKKCWKEQPDERPNFSELVTTIITNLEEIHSSSWLQTVRNAGTKPGNDSIIVIITDVNGDSQEQLQILN